MKLSTCAFCHSQFWAPDGSESEYCCADHRRLGRSAKMTVIGKSFDTSKARSCITVESRQRQRLAMLKRSRVVGPGPDTDWFSNVEAGVRERIRKMIASRKPVVNVPSSTGSIRKYGLSFDSNVELFFYEELMKRGIPATRSVPFADWIVDFDVPSFGKMVEIKSWYTVTHLQGVHNVVSRFDDRVWFVEEQDIYDMINHEDTVGYLQGVASTFQSQVMQLLSPDSKPV